MTGNINPNLFKKDRGVKIYYAIPIKGQAYTLLKNVGNLLSSDDHKQWLSTKRGLTSDSCHELILDVSPLNFQSSFQASLGIKCAQALSTNPSKIVLMWSHLMLPEINEFADSVF